VNHGNDAPHTPVACALVLHALDNVATALRALDAGARVQLTGAGSDATWVVLHGSIAICHKFALRPIAQGEQVIKYGEAIGRATRDIDTGEHVHIHNLVSARAC